MYIRYNNSTNNHNQKKNVSHGSPGNFSGEKQRKDEKVFKNPLSFLPKSVYNPETHKFFGIVSAEDILLIGLILMVLDSGCDEDFILVLALLYILLSDYLDFGNILS